MQYQTTRAWLALVLGAGALAGCQSSAPRHAYAGDPLLLSKKPIDGEPRAPGRPVLVAQADPAPPVVPASALAKVEGKPTIDVTGPMTPVTPPTESVAGPKTVEAIPAVRSLDAGGFAATPVTRQIDGIYGHAADYGWLQGVVDKHFLGHLSLRYCDHAVDDPWGGKVILDEDARLAPFHDGDVVEVDGEMLHSAPTETRHAWDQNPHYRIRDIRLVKHGS